MKKIIYFIDRPNLYGSELHVLQVIEYLREFDNITVIAFGEGPMIEKVKALDIPYYVVPISWIPKLSKIRRLLKLCKSISPDIIHGHQPKATLYAGIISKLLNYRCVNTIHSSAGDTSFSKKGFFQKKITFGFHSFVQFTSELLADRVVYVSKTSSKACYFKGKTRIVYNWIGKNKISKEVQRANLANRKINILFTGSITYLKGVDILIEMMLILNSKKGNFHIDILGTGDENLIDEMKEVFSKNSISATFGGYVTDTLEFLKKADVFMLFSRTETFGIAYAEAAYHGLPVFALNLPVLNEILPSVNFLDNDLNVLSDSFTELISDQKLYDKISHINRQWAIDKFSHDKNISQLEDIYCELLNGCYN